MIGFVMEKYAGILIYYPSS